MIGGVAMIMPYGKFYNLFDAKWVYIASFVLFQASSALCGGAPNMTAEIIGRVFAGTGGNGMYLGLLTLISVNTTDKERPAWISLRYENVRAKLLSALMHPLAALCGVWEQCWGPSSAAALNCIIGDGLSISTVRLPLIH